MLNFSLVLLDRDGVINQDRMTGVRSSQEFELIPGTIDAIVSLKKAHLKVALVSNQALVGRGELSQEELDHLHSELQGHLEQAGAGIDHFFVCTDSHDSLRRKPSPGMLYEAMHLFQTPPSQTVMIGDDVRDFQAANAAQCSFILVKTGKGARRIAEGIFKFLPDDMCHLSSEEWQNIQSTSTQEAHDLKEKRVFSIADNLSEAATWLTFGLC